MQKYSVKPKQQRTKLQRRTETEYLKTRTRLEKQSTLYNLVRTQANQNPAATGICGVQRAPLSYGRLMAQVDYVVRTLNSMGIRRNDRVAIALPYGPEMAVAILGVAAGATAAPLNPDSRESEFEFYLTDVGAKALLVQGGMDSSVRAAAKKLGIPTLELSLEEGAEAGVFTLGSRRALGAKDAIFAKPDDVAVVLPTSGTTARPKMIPLTHAACCAEARTLQAAFELTASDRCLNVMPLFHPHGLRTVLTVLASGGTVVCPPGFHETQFFEWLEEFRPSWYTAVPSIHQTILARAEAHRAIIDRCSLRFIRSSSAPLPMRVMTELQTVFHAPVVDSYGLTETGTIAFTPLPPRKRKNGTVGITAGPEIAILDEQGNLLPQGKVGEVVIRGRNVCKGYEANPAANAAAFTDGWFRTGDQGVIDEEGYLSLTGRLKEIINRGGEKIAPRQIDEVLLNHPAVRQVVAFAVRHPTLGEDIAAAVVLKDGQALSELELREFALEHLPGFKVPSRIVFVDEIPKGPTGKAQRIGLVDLLARDLTVPYELSAKGLERLAAVTFEQVLHQQRVGRNDNFFALGGDSIDATQVVARLMNELGLEITPVTLFRRPTAALLAVELARLQEEQEIGALTEQLRKLPPEEAARLLDEGAGGKA